MQNIKQKEIESLLQNIAKKLDSSVTITYIKDDRYKISKNNRQLEFTISPELLQDVKELGFMSEQDAIAGFVFAKIESIEQSVL
jgi:hypothetical protein